MRKFVLLVSLLTATGLASAQEWELWQTPEWQQWLQAQNWQKFVQPEHQGFLYKSWPQSMAAFQVAGLVGRSYLGIGVADVDAARAKELKLKEERGVEVKKVDSDSPAEKAGLKEGDVVLEYNGQKVEGIESFIRMVRETPVGRSAKLLISRDGNPQTLTATIGRRKASEGSYSFSLPEIRIPPIEVPRPVMVMRTTRIGVETESLTGQLAEYFGVKDGVLVRSVEKDSPADKAGIKAGDIIVKVDDDKITGTRDVSNSLRSSWEKKTVPVQVVRNKKEMTLTLELPEQATRPSSMRRSISVRRERL